MYYYNKLKLLKLNIVVHFIYIKIIIVPYCQCLFIKQMFQINNIEISHNQSYLNLEKDNDLINSNFLTKLFVKTLNLSKCFLFWFYLNKTAISCS